jgi:hypothetical protein
MRASKRQFKKLYGRIQEIWIFIQMPNLFGCNLREEEKEKEGKSLFKKEAKRSQSFLILGSNMREKKGEKILCKALAI